MRKAPASQKERAATTAISIDESLNGPDPAPDVDFINGEQHYKSVVQAGALKTSDRGGYLNREDGFSISDRPIYLDVLEIFARYDRYQQTQR